MRSSIQLAGADAGSRGALPARGMGRYVACVPNVPDSESGVGHGTHWSILVGQYLMVGANSVIEFIPVANATGINLLLA